MQRKRQMRDQVQGLPCIISSCTIRREKNAVNEIMNLLDEVTDVSKDIEDSGSDDEISFEDELKQLQAEKGNKKRFFNSGLNINAITSVSIRDESVNAIDACCKICDKVATTGQNHTRYCMKMTPLQVTCGPFLEDVEKLFKEKWEEVNKSLEGRKIVFDVQTKARMNTGFQKGKEDLKDTIKALLRSEGHQFDYKQHEVVIIIQCNKHLAGFSIITDHQNTKYRSFNLQKLAKEGCAEVPAPGSLMEQPTIAKEEAKEVKETVELKSEEEVVEEKEDSKLVSEDKENNAEEVKAEEEKVEISAEEPALKRACKDEEQ
eukprot:TRINITY_DN774533_c0_g1_i1.p1 TRINITY_DN774533_c0_g1~~TRINITY_DN774533_c0_g1_i1.p1  ORF type:complete len:318 (+),score=110.76 TRINITY_DN774533_c0_g1_i1:299-1252(+)